MHEITQAEYDTAKRHGYVSVCADGVERIMYMDDCGATVLGPFVIK